MPVQSEDKVPKERDFVFFTKRKRSGNGKKRLNACSEPQKSITDSDTRI